MSRIRLLNPEAVHASVEPAVQPPAWLPGLTARRFRCEREARQSGDCEVFLLQTVYRAVVTHLKADTTREHGGLLLGLNLAATNGGTAVVVMHALPAAHSTGTPVRLSMPDEDWKAFNDILKGYEDTGLKLERVGWYHSHPNMSIFLSRHDLDVCSVFPKAAHVALVVDPVGERGGFFVKGTAGYRSGTPQGFIELCNLQRESVVAWKNCTLVTGEAVQMPLPPAVPEVNCVSHHNGQEEHATGSGTIVIDQRPATPRSWLVYALGTVVGLTGVMVLGGWHHLNSVAGERDAARRVAEKAVSENRTLKNAAESQQKKAELLVAEKASAERREAEVQKAAAAQKAEVAKKLDSLEANVRQEIEAIRQNLAAGRPD